ncbi:hypothetical protein [Algoriphagus vanfongensis]|uniref:hypothetical protein n=1 Tax=Algoriphagus vanfongensis TaxID=426371 RepID=UPI00047EF92F|nr:hypothetical protein [Algoriphagus vanfongensis]
METKDYITIGIAILGWTWAIIQYSLNRRNQKNDKALEKRFEVYSSFLSKMDEINQNMRTDPKMIYGITTEFMGRLLKGDEEDTNQALLDFNSELIDYTKKSVQPTMILNQELNKLKLVCSDALLPKIEEYKRLSSDYVDEFQIVLNRISTQKDINVTAKELENIGHSDRILMMTELWQSIERMMRDEIGYYKR